MSTELSHKMSILVSKFHSAALAAVVVAGLVLYGCGGGDRGSESPAANEPAPGLPAGSNAPAPAPEVTNVADLFPPGAGRDLVLNNCAQCHSVACSVIGQRSAERWNNIKAGHVDNVSGVDIDLLFGYLQANFSDAQPEPVVLARFLEGGCTPF